MKTKALAAVLFFALLTMTSLSSAATHSSGSDIGFKGIGGRLAYVSPETWDGTIGFGAVVDLGEIVHQLHWDASILYWSSSTDFFYGSESLRDIGLRSSVQYHFLEGPWEPYAGGGLGIHMYNFSIDNHAGYYFADHSDTQFGLQILGGVEHHFNEKWEGSGEIEFDFANENQTLIQFTLIYLLGK